ncbi:alpha/beta hydrolase [Oryzifoliimicrobium ureilyticus]|uniref:alpha/beta hydrolase n=1 Tax=Oryzifoliimicrobium ureilyticus TaxID=3113724 RepID=UPI0030760319
MDISRRFFLALAASMASGAARAAQDVEEIDLWPAPFAAPEGTQLTETTDDKGAITGVLRPRLRYYRPSKPVGTAILVAAGGGYKRIEAAKESTPACLWLQSLGIAAFELIYRLPREMASTTAPFEDAQRAMRVVRSLAPTHSFESGSIGMMGFSAGGHLAGITATRPNTEYLPVLDDIDTKSARPDFAALLYPIITLMAPYDGSSTRVQLIGHHPSHHDSAEWSVEHHVDADSPTMFLAHAEDDPISPVENSVMMYRALEDSSVAAELKLFHTGGHGWGMGRAGTEPAAWPNEFHHWCRSAGFLHI